MKISEFLSENFQVLVMKYSIFLNRRVFVMYMVKYAEGAGAGKISLLRPLEMKITLL